MADIMKDLNVPQVSKLSDTFGDAETVNTVEPVNLIQKEENDITFHEPMVEEKANISSTWEDAFNVVNPMAIPFNNTELYTYNTKRDYEFKPTEYIKEVGDLSKDEEYLILNKAINKEQADALIKKNRIYNESLKRITEDDSATKYFRMLSAGVIDPTIIIPFAGSAKKIESIVKAKSMLGNMTEKAFTFGTIGAVSNIASESLFDLQDLPTDYTSAATIGFVLGGGLGAIAGGFGGNMYNRDISERMSQPSSFESHLDTDTNVEQIFDENGVHIATKNNEDSDAVYNQLAMTEDDGGAIKKFGFDFLKSSLSRLHENPIKAVQDFARTAGNATVAAKDKFGKFIKQNTTVNDFIINLRGAKQNALDNNYVFYKEKVNNGTFQGSLEEWNKNITNEMRRIESQRALDIDNDFNFQIRNKEEFNYDEVYQKELETYVDNKIAKDLKSDKPAINRDKLLNDKSMQKKAKSNTESLKKKFDKELETYKSDLRKSLQEKYNHNEYLKDNSFSKEILNIKKYYDRIGKTGESMKTKGYEDLDLNGLYTSRIYDWNKISKLSDDELDAIIRNGLTSNPNNKDLLNDIEKLNKEVEDIRNAFRKNSEKQELAEAQYIGRRDIDGVTNVNKFMRERKYNFDDYAIRDILESDIGIMLEKYHFRTAPELGLQYGFKNTNINSITSNLEDRLLKENPELNSKEVGKIVTDAKKTLENLTGVSIMQSTLNNPKSMKVVRMLGLFNTMTLGGKFGMNSVNEIVNALMATETKSLFIGNFGDNLSQIIDIIKGKKGDGIARELMDEIGMLPELVDAMASSKITDIDSYFSGSMAEKFMRKQVDRLMTYNGMKLITGYFQAVTAGNAIKDIRKFSKLLKEGGSLTEKQQARLARWGLDKNDINKLDDVINRHAEFNNDGNIKKLNLAKWDDFEQYHKLTTSIKRAVESGVLQGDTLHLPQWVIEGGPLSKLAFEFLRYPLIANEVLLRRGMTEDFAGFVASALGSIFVFSSVTYLSEQALVSSGLKKESQIKYDIFNSEEDALRLFLKSINYVGAFGATTIAYDKIATLAGFPTFGREYADDISSLFGVSASRLGQLRQLMHGVLTGDIKNEQTLYALKAFLPYLSLPILSDGANLLIKKYGE